MDIWSWIGILVLFTTAIVVALALYCARVDRVAVAKAEARILQRRAEAEIDRTVRQTVTAMFEAVRGVGP